MKRKTVSTVLLLLVALAAGAAHADATTRQIVRDPEWQKRFLGSYGFLSGAEPDVNTTELEMLREVIELMKVDTRAAAAMLQGAVGPNSSAAVDFILANLQFQNGDLPGARKNYEGALAKFPDFRRAHKNLGLLLVQSEQFGPATKHLSKAVELGDRDGRNFGLLGYCHLQLENVIAAEEAYQSAILQEPEVRDWQVGLAQALLGRGKHDEAAALFDSLLKEKPEDAQIWMLQANAYIGLDRPLAAAVNLEAVRALGKAQPRTLVLLGDVYMNEGMYDLAKDAYLEAIEKDAQGTGFETSVRAAELLVRTQAWAEAGEILASIGKRYPKLETDDELRVLTLRAKRARATGGDAEAARLLEQVVERDGTRGDALLELAAYHHEKGDAERALLMVERAEKLEAHEYQALLVHAQFRVADGDYAKAAELLRKALEIRNEPRVERFLARVEQAVRAR
ncbi:MAG: tetratricopeptide repeat protein [Myxococcota bacterium]